MKMVEELKESDSSMIFGGIWCFRSHSESWHSKRDGMFEN